MRKASSILALLEFFMRAIYSFLMLLATPWLYARLYWKGRKNPLYRARIAERFARAPLPVKEVDVWVHAVSLGEVIAAIPLLDALLAEGRTLFVTTMTPTGAERLKGRFGERIPHAFIPYDLQHPMRRFVRALNPRLVLVMETELWPNLLMEVKRAGIPMVLANARLSERSFANYRKLRFFFKPLVGVFSSILAQSPADARRFEALGASADAVEASGNIKFDLQTPKALDPEFSAIKARLGGARLTLMAASTHAPEEAMLLDAFKTLRAELPEAMLWIAPRHPERFDSVATLCREAGFQTGRRSQPESLNASCEVVVLDSLGELPGWYGLSDYAFVGGSFARTGGHNVLEPIALKVPVFSGPHVHNFMAICETLLREEALEIVADAVSLMQAVLRLHNNPGTRNARVQNASRVLEANRGAVAKHLAVVNGLLENRQPIPPDSGAL